MYVDSFFCTCFADDDQTYGLERVTKLDCLDHTCIIIGWTVVIWEFQAAGNSHPEFLKLKYQLLCWFVKATEM